MKYQVLISCEHAGNLIPEAYSTSFQNMEDLMNSHRALDIGAGALSIQIQADWAWPLFMQQISRLLVECNRSLHHPQLFSEISSKFSEKEKNQILAQIYFPYRLQVEKFVAKPIHVHRVLHLSIHTFTPELDSVVRDAELGILFDPKRLKENDFANRWSENIALQNPEWRIKFNYPYLGTDDGFTTYLRKRFGIDYLGIELEVNQALCSDDKIANTAKLISKSLDFVMHAY